MSIAFASKPLSIIPISLALFPTISSYPSLRQELRHFWDAPCIDPDSWPCLSKHRLGPLHASEAGASSNRPDKTYQKAGSAPPASHVLWETSQSVGGVNGTQPPFSAPFESCLGLEAKYAARFRRGAERVGRLVVLGLQLLAVPTPRPQHCQARNRPPPNPQLSFPLPPKYV